MISAVDSNILIDLIADDPTNADSAQTVLERAYDEGAIVISEIVYAEIAPQFDSRHDLDAVLERLHIRLVSSGADVAFLAGQKWGQYRKAGGSRTRLLADFLIGAHAKVHAERLVTRDRGFYREYFADLRLLEE